MKLRKEFYLVFSFMTLTLAALLPSIRSADGSDFVKDNLTAPCGILPFGGEEVGSFEIQTGKKAFLDWIESLTITMAHPPSSKEYVVGFMGLSGRLHSPSETLVNVDEYKADGKVIIVSSEPMPSSHDILFVAEHDGEIDEQTSWSEIEIVASAYLVAHTELAPHPNKFEFRNATIIHTLEASKNVYEVGETLNLKLSLINIGNEDLTISHRSPLFTVSMYTPDGKPVYLDPWGWEDVSIGATLEPMLPYTYIRLPHVQSKDPNQYVDYGIKFCVPGEYVLASYAWFDTEGNEKNVKLYSESVDIRVNPSSSLDLLAGDPMFTDHGPIRDLAVGDEVFVQTDVQNDRPTAINFVYLVLIKDENGFTTSLRWEEASIEPEQKVTVSALWTPEQPGMYQAHVFFWSSLNAPMPLSEAKESLQVAVKESSQLKEEKLDR